MLHHRLATLFLLSVSLSACQAGTGSVEDHGEPASARAELVVGGLEHPWGMAFLPDGGILVSERTGRLRLIRDGRLQAEAIDGVPAVVAKGQGGLLDVALHPDFEREPWVYLTYSAPGQGGQGTALGRGRWNGQALTDWQLLFRQQVLSTRGHHFGSRIVFQDDYVYFGIGDRGERDRAQVLEDAAGSILRLHLDGRIPADNPNAARGGEVAAVYSHGHRNPQGMALHPSSGQLWAHEHGPQGGDELNRIIPGANYGWPVITFGKEYGSGRDIGEGTARADITAPLHQWTPSIAPSGMAFYTAERFPQWRGNLFIGSLKFAYLARLELGEDGQVSAEHRLLQGEIGRIRDVREGPDAYLYVLTDSPDGGLYRVSPAP